MKRNRLVIIVALAATGLWIVPHLRSSSGALDAARARVDTECAAYRGEPALADADVCRFDPYAQAMTRFRHGRDDLAEAAHRLAAGDPVAARVAVRRALSTSQELQRHATLLGAMTAAALVDETLDLLDAHPGQLDRGVLAGVDLDLALRSLEAERLQHLWTLAHDLAERTPPDVAEAIAIDDAAYRDLERAVRTHDLLGCHRAAARTATKHPWPLCGLYDAVQAKAERLARY